MRLVVLLALVIAAPSALACPTPKSSKQKFCFSGSGEPLTRFEVCGNTAVLCTGGVDTEASCATVNLATGAFHHAIAPRSTAPAARIEARNNKAQLCRGTRCVATDLPVLEDPYAVALSANGKRAVVTTEFGLQHDVVVLDTATGKRAQTISINGGKADLIGPAYFVGDAILVLVGQYPLERGYLIKNGKATKLDDVPIARGTPIALGGTRWALPTFGGDQVVVLDTKTATLSSSDASPDDAGACLDCFRNSQDSTIDPARLGRASSGTLVTISVLGVKLVDPKTLDTKRTFALPVCPRPRPGGGA
jgi:hypothetical protein